MKRMQKKGFKITQNKSGAYRIILDDSYGSHYETTCQTFREAGMWVWNMADSHDIAREVNHRMCEVFGRTFA